MLGKSQFHPLSPNLEGFCKKIKPGFQKHRAGIWSMTSQSVIFVRQNLQEKIITKCRLPSTFNFFLYILSYIINDIGSNHLVYYIISSTQWFLWKYMHLYLYITCTRITNVHVMYKYRGMYFHKNLCFILLMCTMRCFDPI